MTAARIRAQFPTSDGFGYQLKGCCRHPFVWASYNISRYIGRHSSRENNNSPLPVKAMVGQCHYLPVSGLGNYNVGEKPTVILYTYINCCFSPFRRVLYAPGENRHNTGKSEAVVAYNTDQSLVFDIAINLRRHPSAE